MFFIEGLCHQRKTEKISNQFQFFFLWNTILKNHQFDFINGPLIKWRKDTWETWRSCTLEDSRNLHLNKWTLLFKVNKDYGIISSKLCCFLIHLWMWTEKERKKNYVCDVLKSKSSKNIIMLLFLFRFFCCCLLYLFFLPRDLCFALW